MTFHLWDNPMAANGCGCIDYAAPDAGALGALFLHRDVRLYHQSDINFIIDTEPDSFAQCFARQHGPFICVIAFRGGDAAFADRRALELGSGNLTTRTARWN